jgi:seryl-tRNA synthetase
MNTLS